MLLTFFLAIVFCAAMALMLISAVAFIQDNRFFSSAPKEAREVLIQREQELLYGARVIGSMMTAPMKWFCRMSGKQKFSEKDVRGMKDTAALCASDRNPYSWNMEYHPYPDGSGFEARFTKCGMCTLMKELGLFDLASAMCRLDYTMSEAGGVSEFVRKYTLASGGPYCDCGYKKKKQA